MHIQRVMTLLSVGLLVFLTLTASFVSAQEFRGRVQGTVTDPSQAVIVGATVTLTNVNTGVSSTRQTDQTGRYLFDLVLPGTYTVTVEFAGFNRLVQENVLVSARGDVTVNATLTPGAVQDTVTVTERAVAVQFNTAKLETTVDRTLVDRMPQFYRNPLLLTRLDPAVVQSDTAREQEPYFTWSGNRQEVGGGRNFSNDLQIDGSPIGIGYKTSYMPAPDAVEEVHVQQNAVDAEYGHSSGSAITLTMKAGTNEWHGNAFYQGQYPWASALENRVIRSINRGRNHMFGGTLGHPVIKNKLFNFFAYEQWKKTDPNDLIMTLPTDLERAGDFSQSRNALGGLRVIYDPWTTQTSPDGRTITRTPFPGNRIPAAMIDSVAKLYVDKLWKPNRPGTGPYNFQNYYVPLPINYDYHNLSDRVDYVPNEKWRFYGRFSHLWTPVTTTNPTGSDFWLSDRGSQRDATQISGDIVYVVSPSTVLNAHGSYRAFIDASRFGVQYPRDFWAKIWPQSNWYKLLFEDPGIPVLVPRMSIMGSGTGEYWFNMGPRGGIWDQRPDGDSVNVKIAQQRGRHYLKAGFETRGTRTTSLLLLNTFGFGFQADATSSTYVSPDIRASGDGFATFLLGAIQPAGGGADSWDSGATSMTVTITPQGQNRFYGAFINDDWKVTRNLTLNLGLRYEYDSAYTDPEDRLTRPLDLNDPIPEMQGAGAPRMPPQLAQFYKGPTIFNGAFRFADSKNRGQWDAGIGVLSPRAGIAYRLNDLTSLRVGYGLFPTPWVGSTTNIFDHTYYYGFRQVTGAPSAVLGVPQMRLSNPFPPDNPIIPAYKKSLGRYTMLGDSFNYVEEKRPRSYSSRVNVSLQRQLPQGFVADVTFYINFTSQLIGTYNVNQVDPRVAYEYKDAINISVPNPFYNYLPVEKFPGPLRYQRNVSLTTLMRKYPHYGTLNVFDGIRGGDMRYYSLQWRVQKSFSSGYAFMVGYNYAFQQDQVFFNDVDNFLQKFTWQDNNRPRHRLTMAGTWEIPIGRGRQFFSGMNRGLDMVIGGWDLTGFLMWRSGWFTRFGGMVVTGDPRLDKPTPQRWFNTAVFAPLPPYTVRTNPWQYPGLTNPGLLNVDGSLVKRVSVTEKYRVELRMDVFNVLNNMTWADPVTNVFAATFGRSTNQLANTFGRRAQLGLRIEF